MSEPTTMMPVSVSASGYEDGLGRRSLEIDHESGTMLERLHLRPELGAFEAFLRDRVELAAVFDDDRFARIRGIERDSRGVLTVVSQFVAGNRLCDLLEAAVGLPADEATCPSVDAALGFLLEVLPALGSLHVSAGHPHGTLGPGRIVLTPASQVVILDWLFGPMIQRLQFNRRRLWADFGVAAPAATGPSRLDVTGDIAQASLTAMMIVLGRPLRENEFPDALPTLVGEVIEIAQIRGSGHFASGLEAFLQRTLPLPARQPHADANEAVAEVRHIAREIGVTRCRAALTTFVEDMNRVLAEERERAEDVLVERSSDEIHAALDDLTAEFTTGIVIEPDDLALAVRDTFVEETVTPPAEQSFDEFGASLSADAGADTASLGDHHAFDPIPAIDASTRYEDIPAAEPVATTEFSDSFAFERSSAPEDPWVTEPEPVPESLVAWEPEPVAPTLSAEAEPVPSVPEPVPVRIVEPEPAPPSPVVSVPPPAAPAAEAPQSKRKRRGSKAQRDKLRSNAAPPPKPPSAPPPPVAIPMPTFSRAPEPFKQDAPAPIPMPTFNRNPAPFKPDPPAAPAPIALRPPALPKPSAPLRLKSEGPSAFSPPPTRVERGDVRDASPFRSFEQQEASSAGNFPWRLAAAAVVVIVAVIGVGRAYLPGNSKAPAETVEAAPAAPPATATKTEGGKAGSLTVTTQPAGAHVLLDGKPVGDSPVTVESVATGKHTLTFVTSSGTVKKSIRMEAGKPLALEVPIYSGWIAVFSPVALDIAENGKGIGSTEQGRLMLTPGRHQLTFSNREMDYKTTQVVDIEPGEERSISLVPTGELNVNATPWAEVWLDGKKVGDTPMGAQRVPLGTHEVIFKNPQYPERRVTVTVTASAPVAASVDFLK